MEYTELDSTECIKMNGEILLDLTKNHLTKRSDVIYLWDLLSKISLPHNCIPVKGLRRNNTVINKLKELNYIRRYSTKFMVNPALAHRDTMLTDYTMKMFNVVLE